MPGGDQFLFVRAGGSGLKVTFVDPDAREAPAAAPAAPVSLRTLAREGNGWRSTLLEEAFADVSARIEPRVGDEKAALLARLGEPGFWEDEGRFEVLARDRAA